MISPAEFLGKLMTELAESERSDIVKLSVEGYSISADDVLKLYLLLRSNKLMELIEEVPMKGGAI